MSGKNKNTAKASGSEMPEGGKPDPVKGCPKKEPPKLKVRVVEKGKPKHLFVNAEVTTSITAALGPTPTDAKGIADFGTVPEGPYEARAKLSDEDAKKFMIPDKPVSFSLAEGDDRTVTIEAEPVNIVTPKIEVEYKVVLLDPNLAQYQAASEEKIHADVTYFEISYTQTNKSFPFKKGASLTCAPANAEIYFDKRCLPESKLTGNLTPQQLNRGAKVKLYLKGVTAGKFQLKLDLEDPGDPHVVREENPAEEEMGVVKLELKIHHFEEPDLKGWEVDPDVDPIDTYYTNLKAKDVPDQKAMGDEDKVKKGRFLHSQDGKNFGRAKVVLKKLDAGQWPAGSESYDIVINTTAASGSLALFNKEWEGEKQESPWKAKVSQALQADTELWAEGLGTSSKLTAIRLEAGVDRDPGGLAKTPKRNGDWGRFTVVEISKVRLEYKPEKDQPIAWDEKEDRYYINFKADQDGRKITLSAKLTEKLKDVTVHFMLAPDKDNMKAANWGEDLPGTWKWKDITEEVKHKDKDDRKNVIHLSAKTDENGFAKKEVRLSRFGGDKFVPAAYIDQDPHLAKYVHGHAELEKKKPILAKKSITVWRKFWYQVVKVQGITTPALGPAEEQYKRVRATMKTCKALGVKRRTVKKMNPQAIYPRYMVILNGGNADALVVSDSNKDQFFNGFKAEAKKPIKIPLLICDAQWDEGGDSSGVNLSLSPADFPRNITTDKLVLNPPLQGGDLLVSGDWTAAERDPDPAKAGTPAEWQNIRNGSLTNADLSVDPNRVNKRDVRVALPAGVGATTPATRVWIQNLVIQGADGPYLGEYDPGTKRILAVYDPTEPVDFQNTIAHELGHAFHQVMEPGATPAGIPAHPNQYLSKGSHCNKHTNKCLMYQSGPIAGSLNRYCEVCHPYVLVEDMSKLA